MSHLCAGCCHQSPDRHPTPQLLLITSLAPVYILGSLPAVVYQGSTGSPAALQRGDGTMPTCAGLPPQPRPKHLIKRDTLSTWSHMKKLLAHTVRLGSSAENSPDWSTIHYAVRALEEEACDTICIF